MVHAPETKIMSFDEKAKTWDQNPEFTKRAKIVAEKMIQVIKPLPAWQAIEFGCGTGLVSYFLKNALHKIYLLDSSKGMIEVLEEKIKKEEIKNFQAIHIQSDLDKTLKDVNVDLLYSSMAMHHVMDLNSSFSWFHDVLKPGGSICIVDLDQEDGRFHWHDTDFDGHHGFSEEAIKKYFHQFGFKIIDYHIFMKIPRILEDGSIKDYPLFFICAVKV